MSPWWDKIGGNGERARPADTRRRSDYEDREPMACGSDRNEPEGTWWPIGKLNLRSGAWVNGPHWHQPQQPWRLGR